MQVIDPPVVARVSKFISPRPVCLESGRYRCDCGNTFLADPDDIGAVCCPLCGQEANGYNGTNFAPRSQWVKRYKCGECGFWHDVGESCQQEEER